MKWRGQTEGLKKGLLKGWIPLSVKLKKHFENNIPIPFAILFAVFTFLQQNKKNFIEILFK